ncbi:hypothetical protein D3C78_1530910 [compost metagenome]
MQAQQQVRLPVLVPHRLCDEPESQQLLAAPGQAVERAAQQAFQRGDHARRRGWRGAVDRPSHGDRDQRLRAHRQQLPHLAELYRGHQGR